MTAPLVRGRCPGALVPMMSGDGLILRVRAPLGRFAPGQLAGLAAIARSTGNGLADLTRRANLQLRGVRPDRLEAAQAGLARLGLLDDRPDSEALRNVIAPPLAGVDPAATIDGAALALALEAELVRRTDALAGLTAKFGFAVDDGGRLPLGPLPVDVTLTGCDGRVRLWPAGAAGCFAEVESGNAPAAAIALARAFLECAARLSPPPRRMAVLVAAIGAEALFAAAGLPFGLATELHGRPATPLAGLLGRQDGFAGVAAPFGRLSADQMEALAAAAPEDIRLTPSRVAILPGAGTPALARLTAAGFIDDPADPRLAVLACPGAPACVQAGAETRAAALRLAGLAGGSADAGPGGRPWLHLSGCAKGCASSAPHRVTLTGRDGRYDLILDGRADGKPVRQGLDLATAETLIRGHLAAPESPS